MGCCLGYDQHGMAEIWVQIAELRCCSTCQPSTIHLPKQRIGPRNTPALGPFSPCMRDYSCGHDWAEQLSHFVFFYQTLWGWLAMSFVPLLSWWETMEKMLKTTALSTITIYCLLCIGRWEKPHLISRGLLQHTALAGQTAAEFIVTFCL